MGLGQKLSTGTRQRDSKDHMVTHPSSSSLGTTISTLHVGSTCTVICCRSSSTHASSWGLEAIGCRAQFPALPHLHFLGTPAEFLWAGVDFSLGCHLWVPPSQHPKLVQLSLVLLAATHTWGQQLTVHLGLS